jgi:hypothetical protein
MIKIASILVFVFFGLHFGISQDQHCCFVSGGCINSSLITVTDPGDANIKASNIADFEGLSKKNVRIKISSQF